MDPWIRKIGFPVVTVAEEPGQISVRQSRFLTSGEVKPEEDQTKWWIRKQSPDRRLRQGSC
jgi:aminopeptidase N